MCVRFKKIRNKDSSFLREALYDAIFVPEGVDPFPRSVIDDPAISKYMKDWDEKKDFGLILLINGKGSGAVWGRSFGKENKGYGFISEDIPEISMSVKKEYRNKGLGSRLLEKFFLIAKKKGFKALSLSVDKQNRAVHFYARHGFEIVDEPGSDYTMKKEL